MTIYEFKPEIRAAYEALTVPFVIYQYVHKRAVALLASDGFCKLIRMSRKDAIQLMNTDMFRDTHPDDIARVSNAANKCIAEGEPYDVVYRSWVEEAQRYGIVHAHSDQLITEDGTRLAITYYVDETHYAAGIGDGSDTTLTEELQARLRSEMPVLTEYYDGLTGLPNFKYFTALVEDARIMTKGMGTDLAVIACDLTGMKAFNNIYGNDAGDQILYDFARMLAKNFAVENCARLGNDHFAAISLASDVEERLNAVFDDMANREKKLPVRAGIYLESIEDVDANTAWDRAKTASDIDRASYHSAFVYFDDKMLRASKISEYVVHNVDAAVKNDWIRVYYQPVFSAKTEKCCGAEALARWQDPEMGFLTPGDFIPPLEDAKLLYKVDLHMIETVITDMKVRKAAGKPVYPVSVNLSRYDCEMCDMVDEINQRVTAAGINKKKLVIEITESVVGLNPTFLKRQVNRFKAAGFDVWMDDFGSGYSSFGTLKSLNFDVIKLDMTLIRDLENNIKQKKLVAGIIGMLRNIDIGTLAEGVETKAQAEILKRIGCERFQGYYYAKPMPKTDAEKIIDKA